MRGLLLSDLAIDQLSQIAPHTADVILDGIQRLRTFPLSAPALSKRGYESFRQLVIRRYRVIYRYKEDEDEVRIYCVLHLRQRLPASEYLIHQIF